MTKRTIIVVIAHWGKTK